MLRWAHQAIGESVIDEAGTAASGGAHVLQLQGRRASGEDFRTGVLGVARKIDKNVDALGRNALCRCLGQQARQIDKFITGSTDALKRLAGAGIE